ncbi:MAG: sulfatase [Daejeonella sp.]
MFKILFFAGVGLTSTFGCYAESYQKKSNRPNIVLLLVDDLGWKDLGFMGSKYYETPNIDKLASQGMLFTNGYAAAANCAPSRACLMSGQNTPRHGIYTVGESDRGSESIRKLIPVKNKEVLSDSVFTLADALKSSGYYTATIGKWHLGEDPRTQGFDYNFGGNMKGSNKYFVPYENKDIIDGPEGEYLTDRLTDEAIKILDEHGNKPFFLYLPYYAVHTPLQAADQKVEKYKKKAGGKGQANAIYAAMIESLDMNIGRLLRKLDNLNLADNTIIIFTSDNGGIRSISQQDPLRAGKGSYYEGGIRVPLVVRWPGKIAAGSTNNTPVTNMDFYPTFLDIAGIKKPDHLLDGVSILPLLAGKTIPERPLYWHFPIYLQPYNIELDQGRDPFFRTRPGSVIRLGDWKLHEYFEDGALELYNLKEDQGERHNVVDKYPAVTKKLHEMLVAWRKETNAPIPTQLNPRFDPNAKPLERKYRKQNK